MRARHIGIETDRTIKVLTSSIQLTGLPAGHAEKRIRFAEGRL